MKTVYVTGHRNPDMDSICSALAYSALKNIIDPEKHYQAVRCSHIGESMTQLLSSAEIAPPPYKSDVYPKVSDVMLSSCEKLDVSTPLTEYARVYTEDSPSVAPVFDNGEFFGLISIEDIAGWTMAHLTDNDGLLNVPRLGDIIKSRELPLSTSDLFEDAKKRLSNSKKRGLAVMDGDTYAGYVTRRCFLNTPKHDLILVDHNESEQSIKGIETANVIEIIDHHRLNAVKTDLPLFIDAEPLGSTCTIVYQLFLRNGIKPDPVTAKILLSGLISDTIILKSPTTTQTDIETARTLAEICGVEAEEYGRKMFSNVKGMKSRNPEDAIVSDFKKYTQNGTRIGIGQCEVTMLHDFRDYANDYLAALEHIRQKNALNWAVLMITDVLKERSILLSTDAPAEKMLSYRKIDSHIFDMPGIMSRKKQLLPEVLHAVSV